jgi:subtilase family serine protease
MRYNRARLLVVAAGAGLLVSSLLTGPASAADSRVTIPGTTPAWATAGNAAGTPSASETVTFRVALKLRDAAGAEKLAVAVSTPANSNYGKYLTPAAFNARFAPTDASVAKVKGYLADEGISVVSVADGNKWVTATGTVAQVNHAFGTVLKTYSWHGKQLRAPANLVSVPSSVGSEVSTVTGLSQDATLRKPNTRTVKENTPTAKAAPSATPPPASQCSDYWGQHQQTLPAAYGSTSFNTYICGYTPAQLRSAYGTAASVAKGTTGKGVTVAIIDAYASPTMLADANNYAKAVGDKPFKPGQYSELVFKPFDLQDECGGEEGWNGEQTLDVEAVHGMAPDANVLYLGAKNCDTGIDDTLNFVVNNHLASIVSNSYGWQGEDVPADEIALEHGIFVQAAAEGIGLYFSSGDDGDNVINGMQPQPDYSASDPMVTAVGGTSLLLDKSGNRFAEVGWETTLDFVDYSKAKATYESPLPGDFYFGGGGGVSTLFAQPWYQQGTVPAKLAKSRGGKAMRVSPDIAAVGDPYTGFYIGQTIDGEFIIDSIGGTSLSCPLIAGIQALASQGRKFAIGFANPLIYSLNASVFRDVVPHSPIHYASVGGSYLGTFDYGTTLATAPGYDDITGRGVPRGALFIAAEH